jgi:hypothetical protein
MDLTKKRRNLETQMKTSPSFKVQDSVALKNSCSQKLSNLKFLLKFKHLPKKRSWIKRLLRQMAKNRRERKWLELKISIS